MLPTSKSKGKKRNENADHSSIDAANLPSAFSTPQYNISTTETMPPLNNRHAQPIVLDRRSDISPQLSFPFLRDSSSTENNKKENTFRPKARLRPRPLLHVEEDSNGSELHHINHNPNGPINFLDRGYHHQQLKQINLDRPVAGEVHGRDIEPCYFDSRISRSLWTPTSLFSAFTNSSVSSSDINDASTWIIPWSVLLQLSADTLITTTSLYVLYLFQCHYLNRYQNLIQFCKFTSICNFFHFKRAINLFFETTKLQY